jgi:hypothetical protein
MEAARLQKVEDSLSKGINALPSAGTSGKIPGGTVGAGPAPSPAANSGKKLDASLSAPSFTVSNHVSRAFAGRDDAKASVNLADPDGADFTPSK